MVAGKYRYFNGKQYIYHDKYEGKMKANRARNALKKVGYYVRTINAGKVVKHVRGKLQTTNIDMILVYKRKR